MRNKAQVVSFVLFVCLLVGVGASLGPAHRAGGDTFPPSPGDSEAFTQPRHDLALAFTVAGTVTSVPVEPGDRVKKGQVLIQLRDKEGEAQIKVLKLQNDSNVSVESAQEALAMANWELERLEQIEERDAGSALELKRARIQKRINELQLAQAQLEKDQLVHQLERARATHARYTLTAPLDGVVERVAVAEGETVEQLKPVLMLVVTDPLWIDAWVPINQTLELAKGAPAWVRLKLPGHYDKPVQGKIIHLSQVADAASDRRLVRVEMANPHQLPAGIEVSLSFSKPEDQASADAQHD